MWQLVASRLEGTPVISVDPPGFGASPVSCDFPTLENYADYVAQAIRTEGVSRALICGAGMGGCVAMALLERHRRLVAGLGLISTNAQIDLPPIRAQRTEMAISALVGRNGTDLFGDPSTWLTTQSLEQYPQLLSDLQTWIKEANLEGVAWAQRALAGRPGRLGTLQRGSLPAMVLRGEQDDLNSATQAEEMARALNTKVISVPRSGHLVALESPGAVARAIMSVYHRCQ